MQSWSSWLKAPVLKTGVRVSVPWVQIPDSAPYGEISVMVARRSVAPEVRVQSSHLTPLKIKSFNICWVNLRFRKVLVDRKIGNKSKREPHEVMVVNPPGAIYAYAQWII